MLEGRVSNVDVSYLQICPIEICLRQASWKVVKPKVIIDLPITLIFKPFDNNGFTHILVSFSLNLLIDTKHLFVFIFNLLLHEEFLKLAPPMGFFIVT